MLSWRNVREGDEFLRVSTDGRFVIRRNAVQKHYVWQYSYEVSDLREGRVETVPTLQAARKLAIKWDAT